MTNIKTKKTSKKGTQDTLMDPPGGEYKQRDITDTTDIKRTAPKDIQEAAGYWFAKKEEFANAKNKVEDAAKDLLDKMDKKEMTMCTVYDDTNKRKVIITIRQGEERLKVKAVKGSEPQVQIF